MMYHEIMNNGDNQPRDGLVPDILRGLLNQQRMTPADLARETGIHKSTISLILNGKQETTSAANVAKIARVLNVSPNYLMGLSDVAEPTPMMLGDLLLELTQVARKLSPRRQRDLLAMARTYLAMYESRDEDTLTMELMSLIQEYAGIAGLADALRLVERDRARFLARSNEESD